ncbi:MAG: EutN/CcmL family microcompartment protein [Gemmatimonadota bacterium]
MTLGEVKGQVVATAKVDRLEGRKLLLVELLTVSEAGLVWTKKHMVCIDAVGAGEGELVVLVQGSSARLAPEMREVPVDAVIVGIVDAVEAHGGRVRVRGAELAEVREAAR